MQSICTGVYISIARAGKQLAYARTLLSVVMEAATQMEEVVSNFSADRARTSHS